MTNRKARLELYFIFAVALVFAVLELYIDSFERFVGWAAENETLLVTEVLTLAIVLSTGLSIYAWRRWREVVRLEADKVRLQRSVSLEQDAARLMRSYAEAVTRGQETERRRLARELHDDTIQRLIVLNQRVELAAFDHADSAAATDLTHMQGLISEMIDHLRDFVQALRPTYLDELGLTAALRALVKKSRERTDALLELEVLGQEARLDESIELALYRIVQSGLSNILQHAKADMGRVVLDFRPKSAVHLTIEDDGQGFTSFDEAQLVKKGHFGLIGMRERAELIGAEYKLRSKAREGVQISIKIPLDSQSFGTLSGSPEKAIGVL